MQPIPDYASSVAEQLKSMTEAGTLKADKAQMEVANHLDRILHDLKQRRPAAKKSALGWMFAQKRKPQQPVRGLYVHGSVGRGKTMLMDLFFRMAPVEKKRRAHFHEFMADVHARIHAHRQKLKNGETKQADPVPPVAAALREEAELLCFDEFTVTDIADAMILARLFTELFARGCTLVATSNVEPENLYRDGLNRGLFLPFIELLKKYVEVTTLDSPVDYRLEKLESLPVYVAPLSTEADRLMDIAWQRITEGRREIATEIEMKGRSVPVPRAAGSGCPVLLRRALYSAARGIGLSRDCPSVRRYLHRSYPAARSAKAQRDEAFHHPDRRPLRCLRPTFCFRRRHAGGPPDGEEGH